MKSNWKSWLTLNKNRKKFVDVLILFSEAAVFRCSTQKQSFADILQNSREIFKNTFFYRTPTVAASVLKIPKISQENTSARVTF